MRTAPEPAESEFAPLEDSGRATSERSGSVFPAPGFGDEGSGRASGSSLESPPAGWLLTSSEVGFSPAGGLGSSGNPGCFSGGVDAVFEPAVSGFRVLPAASAAAAEIEGSSPGRDARRRQWRAGCRQGALPAVEHGSSFSLFAEPAVAAVGLAARGSAPTGLAGVRAGAGKSVAVVTSLRARSAGGDYGADVTSPGPPPSARPWVSAYLLSGLVRSPPWQPAELVHQLQPVWEPEAAARKPRRSVRSAPPELLSAEVLWVIPPSACPGCWRRRAFAGAGAGRCSLSLGSGVVAVRCT